MHVSRELQAHRLGVRPGFPLWCAASLGREVALLAVTLHGPPSLMVHVYLTSLSHTHTAPLAFLVIRQALNTTCPPAADNLSARADGEDARDERVDATRRHSRVLGHLQGGGQHRLRRAHALTAATSLGAPPNWFPTKTPAWGSSSGCQPGKERMRSSMAWNLAWAERPEKASLILGAG